MIKSLPIEYNSTCLNCDGRGWAFYLVYYYLQKKLRRGRNKNALFRDYDKVARCREKAKICHKCGGCGVVIKTEKVLVMDGESFLNKYIDKHTGTFAYKGNKELKYKMFIFRKKHPILWKRMKEKMTIGKKSKMKMSKEYFKKRRKELSEKIMEFKKMGKDFYKCHICQKNPKVPFNTRNSCIDCFIDIKNKLLDRFKDKSRKEFILYLKDIEQFSFVEISNITGLSTDSCRTIYKNNRNVDKYKPV